VVAVSIIDFILSSFRAWGLLPQRRREPGSTIRLMQRLCQAVKENSVARTGCQQQKNPASGEAGTERK
jgi:hypothetical protein